MPGPTKKIRLAAPTAPVARATSYNPAQIEAIRQTIQRLEADNLEKYVHFPILSNSLEKVKLRKQYS